MKNSTFVPGLTFLHTDETHLTRSLLNHKKYYDSPIKQPAIGLSDHCSVEVQPKVRSKTSESKFTVKSRDLRENNRQALRSYLEQVDITSLINTVDSCEEKASLLQTVVQTGLDFVAPIRTKTIHVTEPPWINQRLKSLIKKRQRVLSSGDQADFRRLKNLVNRERKTCRGKYYSNNVEHLKECSPAKWWTEVKKLSGMSEATSAKDNIIKSLKHLSAEYTPLATCFINGLTTSMAWHRHKGCAFRFSKSI